MRFKSLVVVGHPRTDSFNHALAHQTVHTLTELGHEVTLRDLHAEGFDSALPGSEESRGADLPPVIAEHCDLLAQADGIVVVHPNWWGMPPAVLKGWIDRVFRPGVAYEFVGDDGGEGVPHGLLKARAAVVLNTSNTAAEREQSVFGDPLERVWKDCIFDLCGVPNVHRRMFETIVTSTPEQREGWLAETDQLLRSVFVGV